MLYDYLKIFHIIVAAILLTSVVSGCREWVATKEIQPLQTRTGSTIIPLAILQLFLGFTLISLRHSDLSRLWIGSLAAAFILMILSWLGFVCFERSRRAMLCLSGSALLFMIFLMASRS